MDSIAQLRFSRGIPREDLHVLGLIQLARKWRAKLIVDPDGQFQFPSRFSHAQ